MTKNNIISAFINLPQKVKFAGVGIGMAIIIYIFFGRSTNKIELKKQIDKNIILSPDDVIRVKKGLANTNKWDDLIKKASLSSGVDIKIIKSIMAIESNGNQFAKSFCCYGLMQMLPATFGSWIKLANESQKKIISKYLDTSKSSSQLATDGLNTKIDGYPIIYNPELNILVASIGIKSILDLAKKRTGNNNIAHLAISYNAGGGALNSQIINKGYAKSDSATIYKVFPYIETKNYIKLLVGKDGAIDQQLK